MARHALTYIPTYLPRIFPPSRIQDLDSWSEMGNERVLSLSPFSVLISSLSPFTSFPSRACKKAFRVPTYLGWCVVGVRVDLAGKGMGCKGMAIKSRYISFIGSSYLSIQTPPLLIEWTVKTGWDGTGRGTEDRRER